MTEKRESFMKYVANPKVYTLKKWFLEILKADYVKFDDVVERVAAGLVTDKDMQDFGGLIACLFEKGYRKAIEDYKGQAEKLGLAVNVCPPKSQD